jgi:DNA invertase Pin-like site-specific DNA recombinase
MTLPFQQFIAVQHLARSAYVYIRQATLKQIDENTESIQRQYRLREQAVAYGWPRERIVVIDDDVGYSGATTADRAGFQRLVSDIRLGRVGVVLTLEVSRLTRNHADWHKLLETCAIANTLVLCEDGLCQPRNLALWSQTTTDFLLGVRP